MKKILVLIAMLSIGMAAFAQNSTIAVPAPKTMNIGEGNEWIPLFIQGVITTNFQNYSGMKVVDRQNSDMVKAEQRLSENAEFSDADAIEMGKITHAHLIVTGSITGKSTSYALMFSITDAETGETKASATVPNCLFSALENGDAANQISYDLMTGYGISLSADAKKKLTQKASVMTAENTAQASVAKGIVAEQSGSNIEALTYYIQAKKNDKKLSEATSRMTNMTTVVSTGNFGKNAKNMIKLRNDWDKLLTEAAEFIKSNPPSFDLYYFNDIEAKEMTERDYTNGTMTFTVSAPYFTWNNREEFLENKKVADDLVKGLQQIEQSKNWGEKINGFPWTYIPEYGTAYNNSTNKFVINLLDLSKKVIGRIEDYVEVNIDREKWDCNVPHCSGVYALRSMKEFKNISVNDADTDKLYISISLTNAKNILSVQPAPSDVISFDKAVAALKSGNYGKIIKTPYYGMPRFANLDKVGEQLSSIPNDPWYQIQRIDAASNPFSRLDSTRHGDLHRKVLVDFVDISNRLVDYEEYIPKWVYIPGKVTSPYLGYYTYSGDKNAIIITIPDGYESIDEKSFKGCKKVETLIIPYSISSIGDGLLKGSKTFKTIKYRGSQAEWNKIEIGYKNDFLKKVNIEFNYKGE